MIRTLIADDDALLRAALRTMVDWEALGYTLCGTAPTGCRCWNCYSAPPWTC